MMGNRTLKAEADLFEVPMLRQLNMPSIFAVFASGEVMVQPCHVGIDALDLLRLLDGTPGRAYVVVPESGFQEIERITVKDTILISVSWLKAINWGDDLETMEARIRLAVGDWKSDPDNSQVRRLEDSYILAGIEGATDVLGNE